MTTVPRNREEALDALVAQDVARWGEAEREASRRLHGRQTYGLLLNTLYARAALAADAAGRDPEQDPDVVALRDAASKALTDADWRVLRQGG